MNVIAEAFSSPDPVTFLERFVALKTQTLGAVCTTWLIENNEISRELTALTLRKPDVLKSRTSGVCVGTRMLQP